MELKLCSEGDLERALLAVPDRLFSFPESEGENKENNYFSLLFPFA